MACCYCFFKQRIQETRQVKTDLSFTYLHKPLTFNSKLCFLDISPQYINCSAFILSRVNKCRVCYCKPPSGTHFRIIISQGTFYFCPGHRRLWVATGRAVKRSRLVSFHCLCVRRYNHNGKRNRFSRNSLQSHHPSGSHCTCWGYCIVQLQALII